MFFETLMRKFSSALFHVNVKKLEPTFNIITQIVMPLTTKCCILYIISYTWFWRQGLFLYIYKSTGAFSPQRDFYRFPIPFFYGFTLMKQFNLTQQALPAHFHCLPFYFHQFFFSFSFLRLSPTRDNFSGFQDVMIIRTFAFLHLTSTVHFKTLTKNPWRRTDIFNKRRESLKMCLQTRKRSEEIILNLF